MAEVCLAERRKKQKWSSDPRGTTWSKDKQKFGYRMLEKMGWSDGSGLGASADGMTTHVKIDYKNNTLGLGTTQQHADNWIEHQSGFDGLLASLQQQSHSEPTSANASGRNSPSGGLQAKANQSKARINYSKFLRGKDISRYSSTDMSCIFGSRGGGGGGAEQGDFLPEALSRGPQSSGESSSDSDSESEASEQEEEEDSRTTELNTVVSTQSVQDYFAAKLAQLKRGRLAASQQGWLNSTSTSAEDKTNSLSEDTPSSTAANTPAPDSPDTSSSHPAKRKKKKKKKGKEEVPIDEDVVVVTKKAKRKREPSDEEETAELKKKKKKMSKQPHTAVDEKTKKQKSKKSKKSKKPDSS